MAEETTAGAGQADEPHFGEIRRMLDDLPEIDRDAAHAAGHAILAGSGRLATLARFLAGWQGRPTPQMTHPRLTLFAASHGAATALGIDPVATSEAAVKRFLDGETPLNRLAESLDSDLRVYELSVELASADFTQGPALEEADCARAMTYGMIAVEPGIDVLALASISAESELPAAALATLLLGGMAADWCGPAADPARLALIDKAVSLHAGTRADPLDALRCLGGLDIAAMAGAILACRFARTPVLIDGRDALAAALVLRALEPAAIQHCLLSHISADPLTAALGRALGFEPLLDLGISTGDGVASATALAILRAACACQAAASQ